MDETLYTLTLSDDTTLKNLKLNGTNFITAEAITEDTFSGNCSPVIISDGENEEIHEHMELVQITSPVEGEYWFVLRDISEQELLLMEIRANQDYIAMMTDVEL